MFSSSRYCCVQVFEKPIPLQPDKTEIITLAACTLHNYIRSHRINNDITDANDGNWRNREYMGLGEIAAMQHGQNSSNEAKAIRDKFCNYFIGSGAVEWQDRMV